MIPIPSGTWLNTYINTYMHTCVHQDSHEGVVHPRKVELMCSYAFIKM